MTYTYQEFPRWYYSVETGKGKVFDKLEDVPAVGWSKDPEAYLNNAAPPSSEALNEQEDSYGGFTKAELEQLLRRNNQRVYARDSAPKMYERAEAAGLITNGQLSEPSDLG